MATNPLIVLQGSRPVDLGNELLRIEQRRGAAENRRATRQRTDELERTEGQRDEERSLKIDQGREQLSGMELRNEAERRKQQAVMAKIAEAHVADLLNEPDMARRAAKHDKFQSLMGIDLDNDPSPDDLSDEGLEDIRGVLSAQAGGIGQFKPIGVPFPMTENGQDFLAQQVQNPNGTIGVVKTPLSGEFLDRQGRTGRDRVEEAGDRAVVVQSAQTEGFEDRRGIEEDTAAGIEEEKTRGRGIQNRRDETIAVGIDAAKGIPTLRRGIELLRFVETGGYDAALIRAKQFFGVEAADEGELAANLGKAVLSQLRATFGAQFTEREGARLEGIEARLGASTETNVRLLENALETAVGAAERGIEAAVESKDFATAERIQRQIGRVLGEGGDDEVSEGTIIENDAGDRLILQGGQWVPLDG